MKEKVIKFDNGEQIKSVATNYEEGFVTIRYEDSGWKKGDILTRIDKFGWILIFDKLANGDLLPIINYRYGDGIVTYSDGHGCEGNYRLATPSEKEILFEALKKEGKRWNAETLKLEDAFKDGDILRFGRAGGEYTCIFKSNRTTTTRIHHVLTVNGCMSLSDWCLNENARYATESEKQDLIKTLKDNGKIWNSDKKVLEDIKQEYKEGDILYGEIEKIKFTFIFKDYDDDGDLNCHYYMGGNKYNDGGFILNHKSIRPATPEEKVTLYTHLVKRGMYFSKSENKLIKF